MASAQTFSPKPNSNILVIGAHPDDIKSVSGTMFKARETGCKISYLLMTRGEGLVGYTNRIKDPIVMGEVRIEELHRYLDKIGIGRSNLISLGLPNTDRTLPSICDAYYSKKGDPYFDTMLNNDHVFYKDVEAKNLPYRGEDVVNVLAKVIGRVKPDAIYTHHPYDHHIDHRSVVLLVRRALKEVKAAKKLKKAPSLYGVLVYYYGFKWPPKEKFFWSSKLNGYFPGCTPMQVRLSKEKFEEKKNAAMIFTPTLSVEYIHEHMKHDEVIWRI